MPLSKSTCLFLLVSVGIHVGTSATSAQDAGPGPFGEQGPSPCNVKGGQSSPQDYKYDVSATHEMICWSYFPEKGAVIGTNQINPGCGKLVMSNDGWQY